MYKTQPQCFPELMCIISPVWSANTQTKKNRQCNSCMYSQSSLLNTRRVPCYRSKNSDWSNKKRSTVVQSGTTWQKRPHWSELKPSTLATSSIQLHFKPRRKSTALRTHIHKHYTWFKIGTKLWLSVYSTCMLLRAFFSSKCTEVKMLVQ